MYISLEAIGAVAIHVALLLACVGYAAFLAQPHIYKAYHPRHTIWTVIGGEILVGVAFALACAVDAAWIRAEPMIAFAFFVTLQSFAAIPIWRWQHEQAREEKAREQAIEQRLLEEERNYGN